jgi:hypothetical protein
MRSGIPDEGRGAEDPLLAFESEADLAAPPAVRLARKTVARLKALRFRFDPPSLVSIPRGKLLVAAAALVTITAIGVPLVRPKPSAAPTLVSSPRPDVQLVRDPIAPAVAPSAAAVAATAPAAARAGAPLLGGWLTVNSPVVLEIRENGRLIGTTAVPRIMVPVGRHRLEIGSDTLGYREARTVDVAAGAVAEVKIAPPKGRLNVNARPWANVLVDGRDVGQTPIANLSLPIGRHELVLRHPQLGERRQTVVVTRTGVTRFGVDFSK